MEGVTPLLSHEKAETLRILGKYKRLVLLGKVHLPFAEACRLVGPDCAYHLYSRPVPPKQRAHRRKR
jgi:hypothetical protein